MNFQINAGSTVFMKCFFDAKSNLTIGSCSVINRNCRIDTRGEIRIGDNVSVSADVILLSADHDMDTLNMQGRIKSIKIENYAWIGTRAMILPGVIIGKGAVVAAGSVVTKNVEPFDVVAGIPAKKIKTRLYQGDYTYSASFKRLFQ